MAENPGPFLPASHPRLPRPFAKPPKLSAAISLPPRPPRHCGQVRTWSEGSRAGSLQAAAPPRAGPAGGSACPKFALKPGVCRGLSPSPRRLFLPILFGEPLFLIFFFFVSIAWLGMGCSITGIWGWGPPGNGGCAGVLSPGGHGSGVRGTGIAAEAEQGMGGSGSAPGAAAAGGIPAAAPGRAARAGAERAHVRGGSGGRAGPGGPCGQSRPSRGEGAWVGREPAGEREAGPGERRAGDAAAGPGPGRRRRRAGSVPASVARRHSEIKQPGSPANLNLAGSSAAARPAGGGGRPAPSPPPPPHAPLSLLLCS